MKNKKGVISPLTMIVISISLIIVLTVIVSALKNKNLTAPGNSSSEVQCDVGISDTVFGEPEISSVNCNIVDTCLFSLSPLSLFSEEGNIKLIVSGRTVDSKSYSVGKFIGDTTKSLNTCTKASSGTIRLVDENNNLIDSQEVTW